eukprot:288205-Alexandrium_andersonii.AAC.1
MCIRDSSPSLRQGRGCLRLRSRGRDLIAPTARRYQFRVRASNLPAASFSAFAFARGPRL